MVAAVEFDQLRLKERKIGKRCERPAFIRKWDEQGKGGCRITS